MDLKDDQKSRNCCKHPHESRYNETNARQLFVHKINPFDTVGGNVGDVRKNLPNKRNNEEFIDIFDNKPNRDTSQGRVNEMLNKYAFSNNYNEQMFFKEQNDSYHCGDQRPYAQSMVSMSANTFTTQYSFCSRDVFKNPRYEYELSFENYEKDYNRHDALSSNEMMRDHIRADENEQCEDNNHGYPLPNTYNQEFVYKTIQKNAKLQRIVRRLLVEREREKQRESWNNYINDLKNKHRYYSNEPSRISPQYVPGDHNTPEMIKDFCNMRLDWLQSNPGQHFLEDVYDARDTTPLITNSRYSHDYDGSMPPDIGSFIFDKDRLCYPACSQANMLRCNRERQGYAYNWRTRPSGRYFHGSNNGIVLDNNRTSRIDSIQDAARSYFPVPPHTRKPWGASASMQTANLPLVNEEDYKELNVSKPGPVQGGYNSIYLPHATEATASIEKETTEQTQYVMVPFEQEPLKRYVQASVSVTQEDTKVDKDVNVPSKHESFRNNKHLNVANKTITLKNKKVEACIIPKPLKNFEKNDCFKENFKKVTDNIIKLKAKIRQSEEATKLKSLATIEEKIECLMNTMNSIMTDIQEKRNTLLSKRSAAVSACRFVTANRTVLNRHSSDPYNYKTVDYVAQNSSRSFTVSEIVPDEMRRHRNASISKMEAMLLEEIKKSDKAKSDIEEMLNIRNDRSCSVQITFDIPTKEISTEVTDSVSKTRLKPQSQSLFQNIPPSDQRAMTIAVNTDPLGLFALLRVSTETVKQILSYVPNLNYHSYLSLLPLLLPSRRCAPHYTCNICGASFRQPSQLSSHVKQHNLGKTRDCCVCRHALDLKCARAALFTCQHCGQRFTRAYCCELHQQSCARQLGIKHDVRSSHVMLQ